MSNREYLGYELRSYDPCFNYNRDNYACSDRSFKMLQNIMDRTCPGRPSKPYDVQYADRSYETVPLQERKVGLVNPTSYTFNVQGLWTVPFGRMPRGIYANGVPCTSQMPAYGQRAGCCSRTN